MSAPVREGEVLAGKYRVERILGEGGMGVVVAAHHLQLDQRVALKFLLPAALGNPDAIERFAREARAAARIKSVHVARVIDVGVLESGAPYMVMEFLQGSDLHEHMRAHGPLGFAETATYVLEACEALAEAHVAGIVHRDLKPANLFLAKQPDGSAMIKVLDFGISKNVSPTPSNPEAALTKTAHVVGSLLYMPPEQMRSARKVDARADIWALGASMFHLLTGEAPFVAESLPALVNAIQEESPRKLRELRRDAPAELEAIVSRCMQRAPEDRYADVAELARALAPFAPPDARRSVEKIARVLMGAGQTVPEATPLSSLRPGAPADASTLTLSRRPPTTSAWANTEATDATQAARKRRAMAGVALVGVAAISVGAFALRSPSQPAPAASSRVETASATTATTTASASASASATTTTTAPATATATATASDAAAPRARPTATAAAAATTAPPAASPAPAPSEPKKNPLQIQLK